MAIYQMLNENDYYPRSIHSTPHSPIHFGLTQNDSWQRWVTSSISNVSTALMAPVWFGAVRNWLRFPLWNEREEFAMALGEVMRLREEATRD